MDKSTSKKFVLQFLDEKQENVCRMKIRNAKSSIKNQLFSLVPGYITSPSEAIYWCFHGLLEYPECPSCGKPLSSKRFKSFSEGYYEYCSISCCKKSLVSQEKTKQTNLERYGVEHSSKSIEIKNKIKQTNFERYGFEYGFSSDIVKNKIKQTNIERYGVGNPAQSKDVQNKTKRTNTERYGVEYSVVASPVQDKIKQTNIGRYGATWAISSGCVKDKIKQTNIGRYGVEWPLQSDKIKEKIKQTNLEKYGVDHISQSKKFKEIVKQSVLEKYGTEYLMSSKIIREKIYITKKQNFITNILPKRLSLIKEIENVVPDGWTEQNYENRINDYSWKHLSCGFVFSANIGNENTPPRCPKCFTTLISKPHQKLIDQLLLLNPNFNIKINDRQQIKPLELDIWFPDHNIAIEVNGIYWHQDKVDGSNEYHLLKKTELCASKGIQLLHFWDYEIDTDVNLVAHIILSKIGFNNKRIGARKLTLKDISWNDAKNFLEYQHLQHSGMAGKSAGLYLNDELLACAVIGKARYSKKDEQELYRFCVKRGWSVPGGLSRLVKHLRNPNIPLISYADKRYSIGRGYLPAGFILENHTSPNYYYVKKDQIISRIGAQKHKLPELLGKLFDENLTEGENMKQAGFIKISDCGNIKLRLK